MKKPWNKGRLGRKGNNTHVPAGSRRERVGVEMGLGALKLMRLRPGQRPSHVYEDAAAMAMVEGTEHSRRLSYYDRGPVTAKDFAYMKAKFACRREKSKTAYFANEALRADVKAWAVATLSHVPEPSAANDVGLSSTMAARSCEAWLNDRRWPVIVSRDRMAVWLRELGFGTNNGRWNCGFRTLEDPDDVAEQ